ncbi:DISARM system SNF2-like helicase DrmD [Marinitenerispora sediminis]|uniref:Helicase n=1 Tax=Marinitenerispora sediminis TaxID=1931232 RepID=A0A368TBL5_9ACTN|nr:DISARM system SNF2-like helicase DrmD [Marinitenerispora sediminis]RCV58162.1 hypothetical protein DEF28_00380 [Marinitenerispora sediminis]RCV61453.1 hypothetical protein DEF23_02195 [Marinitenerispora sediminis]RCV62533.1 hypothetical protein DEF24_00730 [Marinitenerispora sediminis]
MAIEVQPATEDSATPEVGQLVTVRNRVWVVSDVKTGSIASSDKVRASAEPQRVLSLVSIEDDAPDESIDVLWEIEPGREIHESTQLPDLTGGIDEPTQLDAFLHAVWWGAVTSADTTAIQAPFRSGIEIEDYQLEPVVRALQMPRTNLLIADDVGLGKTIEAGLVMQELHLRHRARTMLIVCPAGLTRQWHDEMRDKFGLEFRIVDTELLRRLRRERSLYANPWTHYPRLIVSIDWLKRERPRRLLREILPDVVSYPRVFDLLVVDEVHSCAPAGRGKYAVDSQRTLAIRELAPHCEHRLFLSATPHNGYPESFSALLEMLDERRFARGLPPTPEQRDRVMVRRLKRDLGTDWQGKPRFAQRRIRYLEVEYAAAEREAHRLLNEYAASRRKQGSRHSADFVTTLLKKRLFSSPKAIAETVDTHLTTMLAKDEPASPLSEETVQRVLVPLSERLDATAEHEAEYREAEFEAFAVARRGAPPLTHHEHDLLIRLRNWADQAKDLPDAKFRALRDWLDPVVFTVGGPGQDAAWGTDRVIIFTEYRDTQRWLHERLLAAGYGGSKGERIALLYGGQDVQERERVKNVFTDRPELDDVRILIATDSASEGINLQRHCHRLLHWEIPWNPNRLEQRNGRIDRHGQPAEYVDVLHFVPHGWQEASAGSLEDELGFLRIAAEKVERIREDLGSAGEIIAAQVEQKMLGRRSEWQETDVEIRRRAASGAAKLRVEHDMRRELERLRDELTASRASLDLTPENLEHVVRTALRLAHRRDLIEAKPPEGVRARCFRLPQLAGAWASARNSGLPHPVTGEERLITFDPDAVVGRNDLVLLHLKHRLVDLCLTLLRRELWSGGEYLRRVTARVVRTGTLRTPAVVIHGRLVLTGAAGTRLHEEVVAAGGRIDGGRFVPATEQDVTSWLTAATDEPAPESIRQGLGAVWPALEAPLREALGERAARRTGELQETLATRCKEEVRAVQKVLDELARGIREALNDTPKWHQDSLFDFTAGERDQLRRDRTALEERLAGIPRQKKEEAKNLRHRYAHPEARWFPAAVTFLVPAALAARG